MNSMLTALYVVIGSFNALVTLIGESRRPHLRGECAVTENALRIGLAAYLNFLLSVLGLLILRNREPSQPGRRGFHYRTWTGNPIIFSVISSLLILRGVITSPIQGLMVGVVALVGLGAFVLRFGIRGFLEPVEVAPESPI